MNVLHAESLTIGYQRFRRPDRIIAQGLNLSLRPGELVCLLGPNGAGKSTLLRTLAGMQRPLTGNVVLQDREVHAMTPFERARVLGVVLTERVDVGILSAYDTVALGRYPYTDWAGGLTDVDETIISRALTLTGADQLAAQYVHELSDGQRQKVMIARALAQEPRVMLLDEPTAFLDLPHRIETMQMLRRLPRQSGCAVLVAIHDLDLALRNADRVWLLGNDGQIHQGAPEDLVLNGALEEVFRRKNLQFDLNSGSFSVANGHRQEIALDGHGIPAIWTQRALERAGFEVSPKNGNRTAWLVTISDHNGALAWTLSHPEDPSRECSSLGELISSLS